MRLTLCRWRNKVPLMFLARHLPGALLCGMLLNSSAGSAVSGVQIRQLDDRLRVEIDGELFTHPHGGNHAASSQSA
jgi:hypothetical protein